MSKRDDVVIEAVNSLKNGEFGVTAIKVELEADLERYGEVEEMHEDIMSELADIGLAANMGSDENPRYVVKRPLMYANTYNDGSVDTELTFTLSVERPADVLKLPLILQVFKAVSEQHGDKFDVDGAGMHIALLNDKNCVYDPRTFKRVKPYDGVRFRNFSESMIRLLPALYFLGSWDKESRQMSYRRPQIRQCNAETNHRYDPDSNKYSAVAFRHGAIEFRVFETCYDKPEVILDDIVVIANAMQFWTRRYTPNNLKPMPGPVRFGNDSGHGLARLYTVEKHIDLLNEGLKILKPRYYTLNELRRQRDFYVTKTAIRKSRVQARMQASENYIKYEKQFQWQVIYEQQDLIRRYLAEYVNGDKDGDPKKVMKEVAKKAKREFKHYSGMKKLKKLEYIREQMKNNLPKEGNWELGESRPAPRSQPSQRPVTLTPAEIAEVWSHGMMVDYATIEVERPF